MRLIRSHSVTLLGLDPGFASTGYAVLLRDAPGCWGVVAAGVIRTRKASKRVRTYASDDNVVRARVIGTALDAVVRAYRPDAVCAEAMSFPRSASVAAKLAMCWGVVAELTRRYDLALVQVRPQQVKQVVCGTSTASKEAMTRAILQQYPSVARLLPRATGQHEHVVDSVGAALACLDSDVVHALERRS